MHPALRERLRHLVWLYSLVCVESGRKSRRPVFSRRDSYVVDIYQNRRGEEILIPIHNIWFYGEILKIITFYHFNTNPNFPLFSLCTVKLSMSSPSNHMLDIYQNRRGENRRGEEILIPIRNIWFYLPLEAGSFSSNSKGGSVVECLIWDRRVAGPCFHCVLEQEAIIQLWAIIGTPATLTGRCWPAFSGICFLSLSLKKYCQCCRVGL